MRKWGVVGRIYGMKYRWKGHKDRNRHKNRMKRSGQARLVYVKNGNHSIPATWRWARGDARRGKDSHTRQKHIEWLYINISITERDLLLYKRSKHREGMTVIRDQSTEKEWLLYGTKAQRRNDFHKRAKLRREVTLAIGDKHTGRELLLYERPKHREEMTVTRERSSEMKWPLYETKTQRGNDCYMRLKPRDEMTVIWD